MSSRTYIIGRRGEIVLRDDTVSARHAELTVLDDTLFLADLGSTNGTWLIENGRRQPFDRGYVQPEQEFAFGNCVRSIAELLNAIEALGGGGVGAAARQASAAAARPGLAAGRAAEAEGDRKRCASCGAVVLVAELVCPVCGGRT